MTLERKKPLQRKSGLSSSGKLRPRSKKMEAIYRERRVLVTEMLDNAGGDNWCQVVLLIHTVDPAHRCGLYVADVHELRSRGRGGSILDRVNCTAICRPCHDWIGRNVELAERLGLLLPGG